MAKPIRQLVAENIRRYRVAEGLSQAELARKARLTDIYISRVERHAKNLTLDSVEQISNALNIPISALIVEPKKVVFRPDPKAARSIRHAIKVLEAFADSLNEDS